MAAAGVEVVVPVVAVVSGGCCHCCFVVDCGRNWQEGNNCGGQSDSTNYKSSNSGSSSNNRYTEATYSSHV